MILTITPKGGRANIMTPTGPSGNGLKKKSGKKKKKRRRQACPGDMAAGDRASDGPVPGLEPWPSAWTSHGPLPGPPPSPGQAGAKGQTEHSEKPCSRFPSSLWSLKDVTPRGATLWRGPPEPGHPGPASAQPQLSLSSAPGSLALRLLRFPPARQSHLNSAPQRTASW